MEQNTPLFIAFQQGYARRNSNNFSRDWKEFQAGYSHLFNTPAPQDVPVVFLVAMEAEIEKIPYTKHVDDGQFLDGKRSGFESGAEWAYGYAQQELKRVQEAQAGVWVKASELKKYPEDNVHYKHTHKDGTVEKGSGFFMVVYHTAPVVWKFVGNGGSNLGDGWFNELYILDESDSLPAKEQAVDPEPLELPLWTEIHVQEIEPGKTKVYWAKHPHFKTGCYDANLKAVIKEARKLFTP